MKHPVSYTFLGFYFNSLIDKGNVLELSETHSKIRNKELFSWLKIRFDGYIDVSLYSKEELDQIESFFESLSVATDEEKRMGVTKNGLCLLVAYCFEGAQRKQNELL